MKIFLFIASLMLFGCELGTVKTETTQRPKPQWNWKADMAITVNGITYDGMASTQLPGPINIKIVSKAKLDVLIVSSCQRYEAYEKLDKGWFGGAGKEFEYKYIPTKTELSGKCPLYFQAYDKSGLTAWGFVGFKYDEKLSAEVECNGKNLKSNGLTICQSKNMFEQVIRFDKDVIFEAEDKCNVTAINKREFKIAPSLGFCNITFTDGVDYHAGIFLGYESAMFRGE